MSEVLKGNRPSARPVPWRTVNVEVLEKNAALAADAELQRRLEAAHREGLEEGLRSGQAETQRLLPSTRHNISAALVELEKIKEQMREESRRDLIRLATTVAARVIHREMVMDSDAIAGLVQAAFLKLQTREVARVRMYPALEPVVAKTLESCGTPANLVLMADSSLSPGELLFETAQGVLDASLDTQLGELERSLLDKPGKWTADPA